jgi:hypothetical protein
MSGRETLKCLMMEKGREKFKNFWLKKYYPYVEFAKKLLF